MSWEFWVFLAVILSNTSLIVSKYLRNSIDTIQLNFWQYLSAIFTILIIHLILSPSPANPATVTIGFLGGLVVGLGSLALYSAIGQNLSKTMLIYSFRSHFSTLLFILFLKEAIYFQPHSFQGALKIISLFTAAIAIILLSKQKNHSSTLSKKWLMLSLTAAITVGGYQVLSKTIIQSLAPTQAIIAQFLGSFLSIVLAALFFKTKLFCRYRLILTDILRGIIFTLSWFCTFNALRLGPGSLTYLLIVLGNTTLPVLYGLIFFKEKATLSSANYLGLILGGLSIIMLSI